MSFQLIPYSILLSVIGISSIYITFRLHRYRTHPDVRWVRVILISSAFWNLAYALELSIIDFDVMLLLDKIQYIGILFAPSGFLFYSLYYVNYKRTSKYISSIIAINIFLGVIVFTNEYHHLIWSHAELSLNGQYFFLEQSYGLGLWAIMFFAFLQVLRSFLLMIRSLRESRHYRSNETIILMIAALFPIGIAVISMVFKSSSPFEPTSLAMGISGVVAGANLSRIRKAEILNATREEVLDNIFAPIMVLDVEKRIIDLNGSAKNIFGPGDKKIINKNLKDLWPDLWELVEESDFSTESKAEISYPFNGALSIFEVHLARLRLSRNREYGFMLALHDITQLRQKSSDLEIMLEANRAVASTLELDEVLAIIAEQMAISARADGCAIALWDQKADTVVTVFEFRRDGYEEVDQPGTTYALDDYPATRKVLEENVDYLIHISDPNADPAEIAYMRDVGTSNLLMLPFSTSDQVLGIVELDHSTDKHVFTEEEIRLSRALASQTAVAVEKARLHAETKKRLQDQVVLREAGAIVSSSFDTKTVLNRLSEHLCKAFDITSSYIFLYNKEKQTVLSVAEYISPCANALEKISDLGVEYDESGEAELELWSKLNAGHYHYQHIDDEDISPLDRRLIEEFGGHTILFVPLMRQDEVIGYIELWESRGKRVFTNDEIALCFDIANQTKLALEKAQQFEQIQKQLAAQIALQEAGAIVSSSLDSQTVLNQLAEHVCKAFDITSAYITLYDEERKISTTVAEYISLVANEMERISDIGLEYDESSSEFPMFWEQLNSGEHYISGISDESINESVRREMEEFGGKTILYIPLRRQENAIGYIELWESRNERNFTDDEIELCFAIANQARIALDRAIRFEQTQKQLVAQIALQEASTIISSALDTNTILTRLAEQMCKAIDATSGYILEVKQGSTNATVIAEYFTENATDLERLSDLGVEYPSIERETEFFEIMKAGGHDFDHYDAVENSPFDINDFDKYGVKSILYIPLIIKEQFIGFTELWESRQKHEFTQEEIDWCHAISRQAAIALEHARLYEQAKVEIAERERVQGQLLHDAFHDKLTNLPNRALLINRLEQAIQRAARREGYHFALLFLDLDGFKIINDSLGHLIGDKLLIRVAKRLEICTRQIDTTSRFGGDEFAILMEEVQSIHSVVTLVERIQAELGSPHNIQGNDLMITASIGIVMSSAEYSDPMAYLRDGDIAMYRAKNMGKSTYEIFDHTMREEVNMRMKLEQDLRNAVDQNELKTHYQPIITLPDQIIFGFEALMRWEHPERGLLPPAEFIPVAEESGLINEMSNILIRDACLQVDQWNGQLVNQAPFSLSVNISGKQLAHPDFLNQLTLILSETGFPGNLLNLEITESSIIQDFEESKKLVRQIKNLGINIHLDDFGTGYSALNYLRQISLDVVKIDRSFVKNIPDKKHTSLIRTIINMARDLDMDVVAEGIETEQQMDELVRLGCTNGQGYLFAKPKDKQAIERLLEKSANS
ncbi:MAG: EAL domain-containing protein [Anaerolineales bacterium]|nr:EAL domain-containing protein [Chloroflexota bacterium]MBL6980016.1 EAL domain-containing protein [Anaerolineales bacterium]